MRNVVVNWQVIAQARAGWESDVRWSSGLGAAALIACVAYTPASAQSHPPVIDVHVHTTNTTPSDALTRMDALNIRYVFVSSLSADVALWSRAMDPSRFLPALVLPCDAGRAPITGRPCWDGSGSLPDLAWLRGELQSGRLRGLGEMSPQYLGMSPNDPALDPYWSLAEEFDVPVGVHMGPGPPGAAYDASPVPFKSPAFSMAASDPLLLEPELLRHKRLRLFVMHAGWPRLESMLALLFAHPNVYVDVAALQSSFMVPRPAYNLYLKALVENGFGKRVMFGSDFPDQEAAGIDAVMGASFLTAEQQRDVLCNNAARFFRLPEQVCAP
jgi:hypothetical protein